MKKIKPPKVIYGLLDKDGVLWAGNGYCTTLKEAIEMRNNIDGDLGKLTVVKYKLAIKQKKKI